MNLSTEEVSASASMEKPQPPSPLSKWIRPKASTRRILLLGTVLYASVVLFWSAHSIGAFTSRLDVSLVDKSRGRLESVGVPKLLSAVERVPVEIKDFPRGRLSAPAQVHWLASHTRLQSRRRAGTGERPELHADRVQRRERVLRSGGHQHRREVPSHEEEVQQLASPQCAVPVR